MKKRVLNPERLRKVPPQFSWIDHRLVLENYFLRCDHCAWALYLFLTSVADAEGLSYYSDASLVQRLKMDPLLLAASRQHIAPLVVDFACDRTGGEGRQKPGEGQGGG